MHYSINDVAKIVNVTYDTVWRWIQRGKMKSTYFQGKKVVSQEQLEEFLATHKKYGNMADAIVQYHSANLYEENIVETLDKRLRDLKAAKELIEISIVQTEQYRKVVMRTQMLNMTKGCREAV